MVARKRRLIWNFNVMNPFEYVNSISSNKNNLMRGTDNDELSEKSYSPFLVNRALSYYTDTLLYANEMNQHSELDNLMQYEYLLHSIRKGKRFSKWSKASTSEEIIAVSKYFNVNLKRSQEYIKLMPREQVEEVVNIINSR